MSNVLVKWQLPTTRESGRPINPADIAHVDLQMSADGGDQYVSVGTFGPDVLETTVTELEPGAWWFRGIVVDKAGKASSPRAASIAIADDTAPGALLDLTLALQ